MTFLSPCTDSIEIKQYLALYLTIEVSSLLTVRVTDSTTILQWCVKCVLCKCLHREELVLASCLVGTTEGISPDRQHLEAIVEGIGLVPLALVLAHNVVIMSGLVR